MPTVTVPCKCGHDNDIFISISAESGGQDSCERCNRLILYESPKGKRITKTEFAHKSGSMQRRD